MTNKENKFGDVIKYYRFILGLKQNELANILHIENRQEIGKIEKLDDISQLSDNNLIKFFIFVNAIKESDIFDEIVTFNTDYLYEIIANEYNNRFNKQDIVAKIIKYQNKPYKK